MADKNLQSIQFPGLSSTYKIPQIDDTLTQEGRPADAKATGDAISQLNTDLIAKTTVRLGTDTDGKFCIITEVE